MTALENGQVVSKPLPEDDRQAIALLVARTGGYSARGVERGFRSATPVLMDRIEALLRERLGCTPQKWARLEPLLREELQRIVPTVATAASRETRTRLAIDASLVLSPRMKGAES